MPMPSIDFSVFDGQELVTYSPVTGPVITDVPALRRPLTQSRQRNVERYVQLQISDVIFHFDASALEAATLALGDTFMDVDGITYTVVFFEWQSLGKSVAIVGRPVP